MNKYKKVYLLSFHNKKELKLIQMVAILKILVISLLLFAYFATSFYGLAFMAGCLIGDLISARLYVTK